MLHITLHGVGRSFLSLDTEGRVIRFDSLSKFVAPGMRIGWIVGPSDFIEKYQLLQEQTTQVRVCSQLYFVCGVGLLAVTKL